MKIRINQNEKSKFTRMCISEAIVSLLKNTPLDKLKISDIAKRAGVSRMSFYKYYHSSHAALNDYLDIIISEYLQQSDADRITKEFLNYDHILYALNFFDRYADYFLTLAKQNEYSIMINGINQFMVEHISSENKLSVYELYSYAGALLNTFLKWEENGKKESAEEIATTLCNFFGTGVSEA
jgi:AcrR family transcriptional regulator